MTDEVYSVTIVHTRPGAHCVVCDTWYPEEKTVYGVALDDPLGIPEFFCRDCAEVYNVRDIKINFTTGG